MSDARRQGGGSPSTGGRGVIVDEVTTAPLGTVASADDSPASAASPPGTSPHGDGDGAEGAERAEQRNTQDPFRFGWHTIDLELVKEFASKPLPRIPDEDLVKTAPPGFTPAEAIPVRSLEPGSPPAAPNARPPITSGQPTPTSARASRWPLVVLFSCAGLGIAHWAAHAPDGRPAEALTVEGFAPPDPAKQPSPAPLLAPPSRSGDETLAASPDEVAPSMAKPAATEPTVTPAAAKSPATPPATAASSATKPATVPPTTAPPATAPPTTAKSPATTPPAESAPAEVTRAERASAPPRTSPGARPETWFDLE